MAKPPLNPCPLTWHTFDFRCELPDDAPEGVWTKVRYGLSQELEVALKAILSWDEMKAYM
jgi:hypothetical protein